jgi:hypothetical protein
VTFSEPASGHDSGPGGLLYGVLPVAGEALHASPSSSKLLIISSIKELVSSPCYQNRNSHASDLKLRISAVPANDPMPARIA